MELAFPGAMRNGSMKKTSPVLVRKPGGGVVLRQMIEIEVPEGTSLLEAESAMEVALMEAGAGLVEELLHAGDTDGKPLLLGGETYTAKSQKEPLVVESTFGAVTIARW